MQRKTLGADKTHKCPDDSVVIKTRIADDEEPEDAAGENGEERNAGGNDGEDDEAILPLLVGLPHRIVLV